MKTFVYLLTVTMGDTNMEGNVYYLNFHKWFGQARELFLLSLMQLPEGMIAPVFFAQKAIMVVTCEDDMKFFQSAYFGDQLRVEINTFGFSRASCRLRARIVNSQTEQVLAEGHQLIAFKDANTGKLVRIPDFLAGAAEYALPEEPEAKTSGK